MRILTVAAAQMGPIQKAEPRQAVVARMLALMDEAKAARADLIVYPELALTTFFPRWHYDRSNRGRRLVRARHAERGDAPAFRACCRNSGLRCPSAMPSSRRMGTISTPRSSPTNTRVSSANTARSIFPAMPNSTPSAASSTSRSAISSRAISAFPVWRALGGVIGMCICNDRRWPETYRVMGLQGVEMVVLGYNTPSVNSQKQDEGLESGCSTTGSASRPAPIRTRPSWSRSRRPAWKMGIR